MNTGFLGPAVATVLTACGIETMHMLQRAYKALKLQQYLPLAVLKLLHWKIYRIKLGMLQQYLPLAVLKLDNFHGNILLFF